MKNKKSHRIVLTSSVVLILCIIGIVAYGFISKKEELSFENIVVDIIIVLWFGTFPISFYTCWRIVCIDEKDHAGIVSHLIYASRGNTLNLVYVLPLLLSPFFILQYIKTFRSDCKKCREQCN